MSNELLEARQHQRGERRGLTGRILETIGKRMVGHNIRGQITFVLPDGHQLSLGIHDNAHFNPHLTIHSYAVVGKCIRRGVIGFGEAFMSGDVDSPDLVCLFRFFLENRAALREAGGRLFKTRTGDRIVHLLRRNSISGSRKNIKAHYDLGNDFYKLWLDPSMTYSSALFVKADLSLEEAQKAKYARALDLMQLTHESQILEIGCGWGGMAEHAGRAGHNVDAITLSSEQLSYAQDRIKQQDLEKHVKLKLADYRHIKGEYDAIVSIEMIEAVGEENWPTYFATVSKLLNPAGRAVIQAITIAPEDFDHYRRNVDFIQRYIFPGGMLLTTQVIEQQAKMRGLKLVSTQNFGPDYARTLNQWATRFSAVEKEVSALGHDDRFRRMWLYYLNYCEAGFSDGKIDVGFHVLEKSDK